VTVKGSSEEHSLLVSKTILTIGSTKWARVWVNPTGVAVLIHSVKPAINIAMTTRNFSLAWKSIKWISFGLPGSSDILGILMNGRFLAIECKTGNAKQSKKQKSFQKMIESFGGLYLIVKPETDVLILVIKGATQ